MLCLFNISHFSSTNCSEVISKRTQKDAGEERVTAKSKPMMNLVSRCSERTPVVLPFTTSESPLKTRHESQSPLSLQTEKYDRTGRPDVYAHSSSYPEWNVDKTWEWKSDELMEDRTGRPVVNAQHTDRFIIENDEMNSHAEAESELSIGSRSFLHRVNDQVRKRQNQSLKDLVYGECLCLPQKGLRILSFCIVPWKDEREPTIKYCMGRQIDVVQKFTRIQNFGQN